MKGSLDKMVENKRKEFPVICFSILFFSFLLVATMLLALYCMPRDPILRDILTLNHMQVITVRPLLFLEAALASNNSQHLAAVLRFFSDFTPGFKSTSEYNRFHQILTEMC